MKDRKRIGQLDRRIKIQKFGPAQDEYGDWVEGWSDWVTVWAAIRPAGGREFWQSEKFNSEATGEIEIRFREGIEPNVMRILYGDRVYHIQYFYHPQERRDRTVLIVKEEQRGEVALPDE